MDLQQRINAAGAHAVSTRRATGPRTWRREMAQAAGCSYQNIAQAAKGEQTTMDAALLRRIANWAGVSEDWMVFDIGQMLGEHPSENTSWTKSSDFPSGTVHPYSDTNTVRAPVVVWARLGTDLYKDFSEIEALESLPVHENASRLVKWFVVDDDMPRFRIKRGYKVALDPSGCKPDSCIEDEIYLFRTTSGRFFMGEFRSLADGEFEAIPDSGLPLDSIRHKIEVVAKHLGTWK